LLFYFFFDDLDAVVSVLDAADVKAATNPGVYWAHAEHSLREPQAQPLLWPDSPPDRRVGARLSGALAVPLSSPGMAYWMVACSVYLYIVTFGDECPYLPHIARQLQHDVPVSSLDAAST
jgi:hypothetical protein